MMIDPLTLINELRATDRYVESIFMRGSCYKFHLFMKTLFPKSIPYIHVDKDHVVTEINGEYYDIRGMIDSKFKDLYIKLTDDDLELVESWSFHENNLLMITECPVCDEPICV